MSIRKQEKEKNQFIYHFCLGKAEGSSQMKKLLGGKGANLAEMCRLGFPVPPGFTLSTKLCRLFYQEGKTLPSSAKAQIEVSLTRLEKVTGKIFGDPKNPLLVSVRSGAPVSMPGMMDTILNLGLSDQTVEGLAQLTQNPRFAWDSYRRFVQMYSEVVMGMNPSLLEAYLQDYKQKKNYSQDTEMNASDWKNIVALFKDTILQDTGHIFPESPKEQLWAAIQAVFLSWENPRAKVYRQINGESDTQGTAVNVQAMVFGNMGEDSATGVVFTRNPSTGEKTLFGEFLPNAQGEDIVAGTRTPFPIVGISEDKNQEKTMQKKMPHIFKNLKDLCHKLELHYRYVQDIEFTIEKNKLWLLQTRNGKCAASARLKILDDFIKEGVMDEKEALLLIPPDSLEDLLHPSIDYSGNHKLLAKGLPASPGGAVGKIVFSSLEATEWEKRGEPVILVRKETSPEDINGMISSKGILTLRGGMTSHAAVVARSMGKPCIVGCEEASINESEKTIKFSSQTLKEGDYITLDGATGKILLGALKTKVSVLNEVFFRFMKRADKYAKLKVLVNADTPEDAKRALDFGASGIGLCRTEHMFFAKDRISIMRKTILSEEPEDRNRALEELFPLQKQDFYELLKIMEGRSVTIRLLDPPLHEFLPQTEGERTSLAKEINWSESKILSLSERLKEVNPMLGHRGCRLAISYPEIYLMQTKALAEATKEILKEKGNPQPEIMIPLVATLKEFQFLKNLLQEELKKTIPELNIPIGTMIELPSACLRAGQIAKEADFFSFGTNDLTQTTLGISRDDSGKFLPKYINKGIFPSDPFVYLDEEGVGELIKEAARRGKQTKNNLKTGICGEQGGNSKSIDFFHKINLDYISCSPYRIPVARLCAAQAALKKNTNSN